MDNFEDEESMPVSPTGQYFNSSVLNIYIIGVLELEIAFDDSQAIPQLRDVFLPINPRFSSIMIQDEKGRKRWKQVEVVLREHLIVPIFPTSMSLKSYDEYFDEYMSRIAMEQLPKNRPLWEVHIIKYPTSNAAGTVIFKLHHALGDGYSLMGALLSCLQRVDDPSLPLTFPSGRAVEPKTNNMTMFGRLLRIASLVFNGISDFGWSVLKSSLIEDDQTPIRSGDEDAKSRPMTISNVSFSLNRIKEIKAMLKVSINDVLVGLIFLGIRLYMKEMEYESSKAESTALVLLNTRNIGGYKSIKEMVDTNAKAPWGNRFAFLHIAIPKLSDTNFSNPLEFVWEAKKIITRKRYSLAVPLTGVFLDLMKKFGGPEVAARYMHDTLKNSSATISNMVGPVEKMALANHPVKGLYFMTPGMPESLTMTILSYMGTIRIAFGVEKGFMDAHKFKSCMENSHEIILKAAQKYCSS